MDLYNYYIYQNAGEIGFDVWKMYVGMYYFLIFFSQTKEHSTGFWLGRRFQCWESYWDTSHSYTSYFPGLFLL